LIFDATSADLNRDTARRLVRAIAERMRAVDQLGWWKSRQVALLLPYTPRGGARKVARDVSAAMQPGSPDWAIYSYPPERLSAGEGTDPIEDSRDRREEAIRDRSTRTHEGTLEMCADKLLAVHDPAWKRAMDIVGSICGLVLFSPVLVLVAIVIKAVSKGPVLFEQERVGRFGEPLRLWKFRTMKVDADSRPHQNYLAELINADRPMTKLDDQRDPRIIPFGNVIRQSCLDELPQLINVLRGEMSLVGPRPCMSYEAAAYRRWQRRRFDSTPGMTGLWQVSGKNKTTFATMVRLDIAYSRLRSPLVDTRILLRTLPVVFSELAGRGPRAHVQPNAAAGLRVPPGSPRPRALSEPPVRQSQGLLALHKTINVSR
jgi:lipopolysaccharide/colanic/teichoic acid biosynthesis glycosyltransferase